MCSYSRDCLFSLNETPLWFPDVLSHVCSSVCTLLYTGSSVLQIDESPVCSLDKVPQALACDWLLACLQVTFPFCKLHQSTTSSMLLILLIKQTGVVFLFFEECVLSCSHFKSCVIYGYCWPVFFLCVLQAVFFPWDHINHFTFFVSFSHVWFAEAVDNHLRTLIILKQFPHPLTHTQTPLLCRP